MISQNNSTKRRHTNPGTDISTVLLVLILALILSACANTEDGPALENSNQDVSGAGPQAAQPAEATTINPTLPPRSEEQPPLPTRPSEAATARAVPAATAYPEPDTAPIGSEILFLRDGVLVAYDLATQEERQLVSDVSEFAATPDGRMLAVVRGSESRASEIWLLDRDGSGLRQSTSNQRSEGRLSWAPDGMTLAYASAETRPPQLPDWVAWARWCATSQVRLLDIASGRETTLEAGCDPAFSRDGLRIAFATPPQEVAPASEGAGVNTGTNTIRLVNRQGENGWNFASAGEGDDDSGLLVYAPAWSPDSKNLAYHRFIGYRALVDLNYTEMGGSFKGDGALMAGGAGWLLAPRFAPDGQSILVIEHNYSDARGWGGYMRWSAQVLQPGQPGEVMLPSGPRTTSASNVAALPYVTGAAWSPDSAELVVALPPGWQDTSTPEEPVFERAVPGEVWRWVPGEAPHERLIQNVDFASPLLWLPAL